VREKSRSSEHSVSGPYGAGISHHPIAHEDHLFLILDRLPHWVALTDGPRLGTAGLTRWIFIAGDRVGVFIRDGRDGNYRDITQSGRLQRWLDVDIKPSLGDDQLVTTLMSGLNQIFQTVPHRDHARREVLDL